MPGKQKQKKTGYTGYAARFVPKKRPVSNPRRPYNPKKPIPSSGKKTLTKIYNRPGVIRPRAQMALRRLTKRRGGSGGARKR